MRRIALVLFLLTSLLAVGLAPGFLSGPASAIPPDCPEGPPCDGPDPDPDPPPTRPPRPPTTNPNPPPPPGPVNFGPWSVDVLPLVDDEVPLRGSVDGARWWVPTLEHSPTFTSLLTGPPPTAGDPIHAGTVPLVNGKLNFPAATMPPGYQVALQVKEQGAIGVLCRTTPRNSQPANGRPLHILAAPPLTTTAAELQAMVSDLVGPVTGLDPGIAVDVTSVTLTPQAGGLRIRTQGKLVLDPSKFTFDHTMVFTLVPSTGPDLRSVLYADSDSYGTATVAWDQVPPPPPDGDNVLALITAALPGELRPPILARATVKVNEYVHGLHAVQWWHEQGFNVSVRAVQYSGAGLTVLPSLCRLG